MPVLWSIVIWEMDGKLQFTPSTLNVSAGDQVCWSNQTAKEHTIVIKAVPQQTVINAAFGSLSEPYQVPASIEYWSWDHSQEKGAISIQKEEHFAETIDIWRQDHIRFTPNPSAASAGDCVYWWNNDVEEGVVIRIEAFLISDEKRLAPPWGSSPPITIPDSIPYRCRGHEGSITIIANALRPTIADAKPNTFLSPDGGQSITLTGTHLLNATVTANGAAAKVTSVNPYGTELVFTTPKGTAGSWADVIVTTGAGEAQTSFGYAPATPTISGSTMCCQGGSVTLRSSSASGNQWFESGNPIGGATNQTYVAAAAGSYTVKVTDNGCTSAASNAVVVTVHPLPDTPAATPDGATVFCEGGSVTLRSSSASGNQWFESVKPIDGATDQRYVTAASGSYTVKVTDNGCTSEASNAVVVTVNPNPNATITAPSTVTANSTHPASVENIGEGAKYEWKITNGAITAPGTTNITFTSGAAGTLTLQCTVTTSAGCRDTKSANVDIAVPPPKAMLDFAIGWRATGHDSVECAPILLRQFPGTTALQMAITLSLTWAGIMNNSIMEASLLAAKYLVSDITSAIKGTLHLDWRTNAAYTNSSLPLMSSAQALYQGDLTDLSAGEMVDFLCVSTLACDYAPTPGSLIGALAAKGVSVEQLSKNPAASYPQFHCWVSTPIAGQNFKQVIVFESTGAEAPANIPGILSTLQAYWPNPHAGSNYPFATIAQPLVSTGCAGANPDDVLTALFQSAASVLPSKYGLGCVMTVVHDRSQADAMTQLFNRLAGK